MEKSSVVSYIIRLVSEAQPNPITGGQLSARVKAVFPDFNAIQFGSKNLREFIKTYIPEVAELGKAGMDVIYGSCARQAELFMPLAAGSSSSSPDRRAPLGQLLSNPRIWKTFASPETIYRLFVVPSGLIRVVRPEESPDPSWRAIPPISAEALLNIAKDFISELPASQQEILLKTLEQSRWWLPYFELLSTLGLKMRWISFRRRRIVEEFEHALAKAVPPALPSQPFPTSFPNVPEPPPRSVETEHQGFMLRRIVTLAVQRMTDPELRALNLPLGYVIDALMEK